MSIWTIVWIYMMDKKVRHVVLTHVEEEVNENGYNHRFYRQKYVTLTFF